MIIKKFTAPTMTEVLSKVREDLGADAIILNTRSAKRGGVFDFVGRSMVEVTAAVDKSPLEKNDRGNRMGSLHTAPVRPSDAKLYPPDKPIAYEPTDKSAFVRHSGSVNVKEIESQVNIERLVNDITELKRSMKVLADSSLKGDMAGLPQVLARLLNVYDKAADFLINGMNGASPILFAGAKPRIVAFVGPTGSGKTTTIAKLAADFTLNMKKEVSILTIDTKRVDAVGQLKAYSRILNIPLYIAYTPDELPNIMPGLIKSDITLVDTPGSCPMDKSQMLEMMEFLKKMVPQEVHIVMSVTTSLDEMKRNFENFGILKPNRILFTKLDETDCYGTMLSFAIHSKKPISYVTFGQNVPGDFEVANPKNLIERNFGRNDKKIT